MKCDYEITYYLNGNPNTLRVPSLDVEENTTNEDIKTQLRDLFTNVLNDPSHALYNDVNNLTKNGLIFQNSKIRSLSSSSLNSSVGLSYEVNKTEHDSNTKLADIRSHLDTATHKYSKLMSSLVTDSDLTLPVMNIIAERYTETDNTNGESGSPFGVYVLGDKGIDTLNLYTAEDSGDLDVFNSDKELAKISTKQLVIYKVNRRLEDWYQRDTKDFNDNIKEIKNGINDRDNSTLNSILTKYPNNSDLLGFAKALYSYSLTNKNLAIHLNKNNNNYTFDKVLESSRDLLSLNRTDHKTLLGIFNKFDNIKTLSSMDTSNLSNQNEDLPFSKSFVSDDPKDYKKSDKTSREVLNAMVDKLSTVYNIPFNIMESSQIAGLFDLNPNATLLYSQQRAFIKDGQVYLNSDKASLAEPIHELGHIILAGLKVSDNVLYNSIISKFSAHPDYESIAKHYPNLDADSLTEEVFVTTLGEQFNGQVAKTSTNNWQIENKSFLGRIYDSIKTFLSGLFGVDSKKFFDLSPYELMNLSFDDIHSHFNGSIMNGDFTSAVELGNLQSNLLENDRYLTASDGSPSELYQHLLSTGIEKDLASSLWIKTQTENFKNWAGNDIAENSKGEPMLFVRNGNDRTFQEATPFADKSALVYLKQPVQINGNNITTLSPTQAKSIYNASYLERKPVRPVDNIETFSAQNNVNLQGSLSEMNKAKSKLSEQFPNYEFEIKSGFGDSYISYYPAVDLDVRALREELMKNKNINKLC